MKTLPSQVTYDWVGGDDIYGNSLVVRQYLYGKKQAFVLDVSGDLGVYLVRPKLYVPLKKEGRGRTPTAYAFDSKPLQIKHLIEQIPDLDWQTITHRNGTKGTLMRKSCMIDVHVWKPQRGTEIEALNLYSLKNYSIISILNTDSFMP